MDCSKWAVSKHTLQFNELTKQTILSFNFLQHFLCIQIKFQKPAFCEAFHYLMKMCVLYTFGSSPVICNAFKMVFVHQCMLLVNLICFPAEHRSLDKNLNKYHVKMWLNISVFVLRNNLYKISSFEYCQVQITNLSLSQSTFPQFRLIRNWAPLPKV